VGSQRNLQVNNVLLVTFHFPQVSGRMRFLRCKSGWRSPASDMLNSCNSRLRLHTERPSDRSKATSGKPGLLFHPLADKKRLQAPPRTSKEPTILQDTNPWNICSRSCS
jgi:hypothetical protein